MTQFSINISVITLLQSIIIILLFIHLRIPVAFLNTMLYHNLMFQLLITHMITKSDGQEKSFFLAGWCYSSTHGEETKVRFILERHWISFT